LITSLVSMCVYLDGVNTFNNGSMINALAAMLKFCV